MSSETDRLAQGRTVIERTYCSMWSDWFGATAVSQAAFRLTYQCTDSGYRPERNEMHLNLPEMNVRKPRTTRVRTTRPHLRPASAGQPGSGSLFMNSYMSTSTR